MLPALLLWLGVAFRSEQSHPSCQNLTTSNAAEHAAQLWHVRQSLATPNVATVLPSADDDVPFCTVCILRDDHFSYYVHRPSAVDCFVAPRIVERKPHQLTFSYNTTFTLYRKSAIASFAEVCEQACL